MTAKYVWIQQKTFYEFIYVLAVDYEPKAKGTQEFFKVV